MKKQLTLIAFVIISLFSFAQIPNYVPINGLVGYWPFNGNANDVSGNGNNGVIIVGPNGTCVYSMDRSNNPNASLLYSGSPNWNSLGSYVKVPNHPSLNFSSAYSVNTWINLSSNIITGEIINKGPDNTGNFLSRINNWQFAFGTYNGAISSTNALSPNSWYMITMTRDINGNGSLYINGSLISTGIIGIPPNNNFDMWFGLHQYGSNGSMYPFQGKIDDIGIWNRALTQQEITNLYNSQIPLTCSATATNNTICAGSNVGLNVVSNTQNLEDTIVKPGNNSIPIIGSAFEYSYSTPSAGWTTNYGGWNLGNLPYVGVNTGAVPNSTLWPLGTTIYLRKQIDLSFFDLTTINWKIAVDNGYSLYINGNLVGSANEGGPAIEWEYSGTFNQNLLVPGINTIALVLTDDGAGAAVFNMLVTGTPYPTNYLWSNGATTPSINVSPTTTTSYTCTVTTNGQSCQASQTITVNPLPSVNAGNDQTVCAGTSVTLAGTGANTYAWNNGVNNGVSFTPAATTTYTVTGTNTTTGCTNSDQVLITLNSLPTVNAGPDQTVCAGTSVTLTGSGANTYAWNNSVNNGIPFIPLNTNVYTVTGTDANNCSNSDQVLITVVETPSISFNLPNQTICSDNNSIGVQIFSTSPNASINWVISSVPPGIIGVNSTIGTTAFIPPMFLINTTPNPQILTIVATAITNEGCGGTSFYTITVNPNPFVNQPLSQVVCCQSSTVPIIPTSNLAGVNYTWTAQPNANLLGFPTNGVGIIPTMTLTNNSSITQTVIYQITPELNGCLGAPVTANVSVLPCSPSVNIPSSQTYCSGDTLPVILFSGTGTSYNWTNTNSTTGIPISGSDAITSIVLQNSSLNTLVSQINVMPSFTDLGLTCQGISETFSITVNPLPYVNAGQDQSICKGDTITLNGSGAVGYAWDNNITDGVDFSPINTTTYTVIGTDLNNCQNSDSVIITVNDPSFITLNESALDSYSLNGTIYTQSGTYTQVTTNAVGCDSTITLNLSLSFTGLNETSLSPFRIYPNPTQDLLFIEFTEDRFDTYSIADASGRKVTSGKLNGKSTEISLNDHSNGLYFLEIPSLGIPIRIIKQ